MKDKLNDEQLILYYYDDGLSAAERRAIAEALERDDGLAERYRALCRDLDALREPADVAAPDGLAYRLQSNLERAARLEHAGMDERGATGYARSLNMRILAWGTALAGAVALGVGIGVWVASGPSPDVPGMVETTHQPSPEWSPVAFQRGLESHFRSGRSDLGNLRGENGNEQGRAALVEALLQQNRLYAGLALQNDAPELVRVLRSFEPLLQQLGREDLSPQEAARLRDQLEFKFAVMLTKLSRGTSEQSESTEEVMSL